MKARVEPIELVNSPAALTACTNDHACVVCVWPRHFRCLVQAQRSTSHTCDTVNHPHGRPTHA